MGAADLPTQKPWQKELAIDGGDTNVDDDFHDEVDDGDDNDTMKIKI